MMPFFRTPRSIAQDLRPGVPRADLELPARALLRPAPEGRQGPNGARCGRGKQEDRRGEAAAEHDGAAQGRRVEEGDERRHTK